MTALVLKEACRSFAQAAAPFIPIKDDAHYEEALELIESLLEEAEDSPDDPINAVIDLLARAVETYENQNEELAAFEKQAMDQPADRAMLRMLMAQHHLGTADLPEIGSKSMVSRVLSGERGLNKNHIKALSQRFRIDPGLFF
ncbi:transcriptional regulator [Alloalcanivorax xenomutans]|uniref:helix-turn-helix domain-containing protein n=1 Tax=Alloalcanivorax xenomutans TaxID=1094342 RepID=UPI0009EEFA68|nr:transcriptional regulator [Alloalcanivorax xenomutans]WOD28633.1 transcriptional regulator [Alloalcanivorax xenomutans]